MTDPDHRPETPKAPLVEGAELVKLAVEAWKKTVDVQQHFNDLELRVRNFAITFTAAVLGLVGWALKEGMDSLLPAGLLAIGTLGWLAFYLMDRHWYHRFLDGAVAHGQGIEDWLCTATGTEVFSLASGIKEASGIHLAPVRKGAQATLAPPHQPVLRRLRLGVRGPHCRVLHARREAGRPVELAEAERPDRRLAGRARHAGRAARGTAADGRTSGGAPSAGGRGARRAGRRVAAALDVAPRDRPDVTNGHRRARYAARSAGWKRMAEAMRTCGSSPRSTIA